MVKGCTQIQNTTPSLAMYCLKQCRAIYNFIPKALCTLNACLMLRSNMISSLPPGIAYALTSRYNLSTYILLAFEEAVTRPTYTNLSTLSTTAVTQTTEDLTGFSCTKFKSSGSLSLQSCNRATKLQHRLGFRHNLTLVGKVLEPIVRSFDLAGHVCKLEPDNRMIDQLLAECTAFVCVFHRFFIADAGEPETLDDYTHTFVIEVCHDDYMSSCQCSSASWCLVAFTFKALVLLTEQVLYWNFHVFEGHVSCAASPYTLAVHLSCTNAAV